jgi:hypothetical protein
MKAIQKYLSVSGYRTVEDCARDSDYVFSQDKWWDHNGCEVDPVDQLNAAIESLCMPIARCVECGRVFNLLDDTDSAEYYYGHDCE